MFKIKSGRLAIVLAAVAGLLILNVPGVALAAGGNGLRVTPVRTPDDLTIKPGASKTIYVTVTNITTTPANLRVIINDFTASSDESGQPALLLTPGQFAPKHSLKRFVKDIPNFTLQPGQQKTISIPIAIPADASGGGYYGTVRFAPAGSGGQDKTVTLAGSVGSLILVRVPGDVKDQLSIASFDARQNGTTKSLFFSNKKISSVIRFQNEGNIQEQPFGKILLKDRSNKILGEYEINDVEPRGNVLPDTIRKFETPIDKIGKFGIYKLVGNFGYGSNGQLLSASTTIYVIPFIFIIGFVVLVALLLFLIFGLPKLIRAYNQRIINQAGRRR
ncbi:MAG: DUF916 domain-containing protein [Patescibacteria group bacterium]|nr:DUF916 domain-containing protein [Patescibacteria group bacterium]